MVVCNSCYTTGLHWRNGKILCEPDGTVHECQVGSKSRGKPFMYHGLPYEYCTEIDIAEERQVRLEGDNWVMYHYGVYFDSTPKAKKKRRNIKK